MAVRLSLGPARQSRKLQRIFPGACALIATTIGLLLAGSGCSSPIAEKPLVMLVMDPLARDLACACVGGYAQRDYRQLADFLGREIGRPVAPVFAANLARGLDQPLPGQLALVVGKESEILADAAAAEMELQPLSRLTDTRGLTTFAGLFVVKAGDPAQRIEDLKGRPLILGPAEAAEKHREALFALVEHGLPLPQTRFVRNTCGDAVFSVIESTNTPAPAAVLSSYALPLLEGCGNIPPEVVRIIGKTKPLPFITIFATKVVPPDLQVALCNGLTAMRKSRRLCRAMESRDGWIPWIGADWPDWRGYARDAGADLPERLPDKPKELWRMAATPRGLGGIAAAADRVIVGGRDATDSADVFRCLDAVDGHILWTLRYPTEHQFDYGQEPRATPVVRDGRVYLLGGGGQLHCVSLKDGTVLWRKHLVYDLGGQPPAWGYSATPLIADDLLIVAPGGTNASLVALRRHSGETVWQSAGRRAAYASFIAGEFGGRRQIVGYDAESLGGWDATTGRRLWELIPPHAGDFNVPTPLALNGHLLLATENNGARLYRFRRGGVIDPKPVAANPDLAPVTSTPVHANGKIFGGCRTGIYCLSADRDLRQVWRLAEDFGDEHMAFFVGDRRLLVLTYNGELLLLDTTASDVKIVSRLRVAPDDSEIYAHPALAGRRLFLRDAESVFCLALE